MFALIFFIGIRRRWFTKRVQEVTRSSSGLSQDKSRVAVRDEPIGDTPMKEHLQPLNMAELYAVDRPRLLPSSEVHQLHGDEVRRD